MPGLTIDFHWQLQDFLHIGTGMSRAGYADRTIRVDSEGAVFLNGGAVKGAIRGSAERIARWLYPNIPAEREDESMPKHPMLRRVFAAIPGDAYAEPASTR